MTVHATVATPASILLLIAFAAGTAAAADTIECHEQGVTSAEFYMGFDGIRHVTGERQVSNELLLARGIDARASAYVGAAFVPGPGFSLDGTDLFLGFLTTALDTDHVDLDLAFDVGVTGTVWSEAVFGPTVELNLDRDPDMATWGGYFRAALPMWRESGPSQLERHVDVCFNPGVYFTPRARQQLLVEYAVDVHLTDSEARRVGASRIALGLNTEIAETLELITQVHADLHRAGDGTEWGVMLGVVTSLPAAF